MATPWPVHRKNCTTPTKYFKGKEQRAGKNLNHFHIKLRGFGMFIHKLRIFTGRKRQNHLKGGRKCRQKLNI